MSLHGAFASMHSHGGPPPSGSAVPIRRPPLPLPLPLHRLHERGGRRVPLRRLAQIALDDPGPRMVIRSAEPYGAMLGREEEATVPTNHQSISCTPRPWAVPESPRIGSLPAHMLILWEKRLRPQSRHPPFCAVFHRRASPS
jgi:hypothetical protein